MIAAEGDVLASIDNFMVAPSATSVFLSQEAARPLIPCLYLYIHASAGVGLLNFTRPATVPAAVIPLPLPSPGDLASPRISPASDQSLEFLYASGTELLKLTYRWAIATETPFKQPLIVKSIANLMFI